MEVTVSVPPLQTEVLWSDRVKISDAIQSPLSLRPILQTCLWMFGRCRTRGHSAGLPSVRLDWTRSSLPTWGFVPWRGEYFRSSHGAGIDVTTSYSKNFLWIFLPHNSTLFCKKRIVWNPSTLLKSLYWLGWRPNSLLLPTLSIYRNCSPSMVIRLSTLSAPSTMSTPSPSISISQPFKNPYEACRAEKSPQTRLWKISYRPISMHNMSY